PVVIVGDSAVQRARERVALRAALGEYLVVGADVSGQVRLFEPLRSVLGGGASGEQENAGRGDGDEEEAAQGQLHRGSNFNGTSALAVPVSTSIFTLLRATPS